MNYILSKEAKIDLQNIWVYTLENWSIEQADRYINLIIDEIEYLCIKPNSGFDFGEIRTGYYRIKVKSQLSFIKLISIKSKLLGFYMKSWISKVIFLNNLAYVEDSKAIG